MSHTPISEQRSQAVVAEPISAVTFDVGGTLEVLIPDWESRLAACRTEIPALLRDYGIRLDSTPEALLEKIMAGIRRYAEEQRREGGEPTPLALWRDFLLPEVEWPDGEEGERLGDALLWVWETRFFRRFLRPEAVSVLQAVREMGLRTAVISNTASPTFVHAQLKRYGLTPELTGPIVLSSNFGRAKPHPSIFRHTASLLGVTPAACVHVGDSPEADVVGAQQAGFRLGVWLDAPDTLYTGERPPSTPIEASIHRLSELPELLRRLIKS